MIVVTAQPVQDDTATTAPRSASVTVALTTTEKTTVTAAAKEAGLSVSAYCRRRILGR